LFSKRNGRSLRRPWDACRDGKVEEVRNLLQNPQLNVNWQNYFGQTPFLIACRCGYIEIVELLLNDERIGVDINKANEYLRTPFWIACFEGHIKVMKLLLNDKRTDINKATLEDWTPLYLACFEGCSEVVKLLLNDQRVDVNQANNDGKTPFWIACGNEYIEIVKLLLNDERVDVNKGNFEGTPLHCICQNNQFEIVQFILVMRRDVNLNAKDNNGKLPIDIAREREQMGIYGWERSRESEEKCRERKMNCAKIIELLESFERNPIKIRTKLRIQLGFAGNSFFF